MLAVKSIFRVETARRVISSVGRALRLHRRCQEFESLITHQIPPKNNPSYYKKPVYIDDKR